MSSSQRDFIRIEHVTKSFWEGERQRAVLNDLSATIAQGEFVAMVGRSGSGKSTLLNLLAGLDQPTTGDIWIDDARISALDDRRRTLFRRDHIGFVFQFFNLISTLTVRENVLLTAELSNPRARQANAQADQLLAAVGLSDRAHVFPDKLSGGEQQRIAIARALRQSARHPRRRTHRQPRRRHRYPGSRSSLASHPRTTQNTRDGHALA